MNNVYITGSFKAPVVHLSAGMDGSHKRGNRGRKLKRPRGKKKREKRGWGQRRRARQKGREKLKASRINSDASAEPLPMQSRSRRGTRPPRRQDLALVCRSPVSEGSSSGGRTRNDRARHQGGDKAEDDQEEAEMKAKGKFGLFGFSRSRSLEYGCNSAGFHRTA